MPQTPRDGKQTAMLVLSVLKILGGTLFVSAALIIMTAGPSLYGALSGMMDMASASAVTEASPGIVVIAMIVGFVGIIHGIVGIGASRPTAQTSLGIAMGFAFLGLNFSCILAFNFQIAVCFAMVALNLARAVLSVMLIASKRREMAAGGTGVTTATGGGAQPS